MSAKIENRSAESTPTMADLAGTIQTLAATLAQSFTELNQRNNASNATLVGLTVILAAMQETAALRPERLAAVTAVMLRDQPALQKDVTKLVSALVNTSREMSNAFAAVAAQAVAEQARTGGARPN